MKDEKTTGQPNEEVVWGKGVENIPEMLNLLHQQHFKGFFAIENETKLNASELKKSLQYFRRLVGNLKPTI
jgi:sugar phosphate isomerase/epimerase